LRFGKKSSVCQRSARESEILFRPRVLNYVSILVPIVENSGCLVATRNFVIFLYYDLLGLVVAPFNAIETVCKLFSFWDAPMRVLLM
jgi:hypothetical protein